MEHQPCGLEIRAARRRWLVCNLFPARVLTAFSFPRAGSALGTPGQVRHRREHSQADPGRGREVADASLEGLAPHKWPVHPSL